MRKEITDLVEGAEWRVARTEPGPWAIDDTSIVSAEKRICDVYGDPDEYHAEFISRARLDIPALCGEVRTLTDYLTALVHVENKIKRAKTGRETGELQEVRANIMKTIAEHIDAKLG